MPKLFSSSTMFFKKKFFAHENMKKPASKVAEPAQIQPKSQFLFHENLPPRDFSIITLPVLVRLRLQRRFWVQMRVGVRLGCRLWPLTGPLLICPLLPVLELFLLLAPFRHGQNCPREYLGKKDIAKYIIHILLLLEGVSKVSRLC